jgi:transposase
LEEGDIVVLENLQAHKSPKVAESWRETDARSDTCRPKARILNPIENAFAKLKAFLRKLAERTVAGLVADLEHCADLFKSEECANYFESCGCDPAELLALDIT